VEYDVATSSDAGAHAQQFPMPADTIVSGQLAAPLRQTKSILLAGPPPTSGATTIPVRSPSPVSSLARTADNGRHWISTRFADNGAGWRQLQFVSPTVGLAIHGYPGATID
jgi:hypothetical protein